MTITAAAGKNPSFKSPYTGRTLQEIVEVILGRDGYLSGGSIADNGSTITIQPVSFVQRGIICTTKAAATGLAVPSLAEPWFLVASTPDDDPDSGVRFSVTTDLAAASSAVIVGYKSNGKWTNLPPINVVEAATDSAVSSLESLGGVREVRDASLNVTSVMALKGSIVEPTGKHRSLPAVGSNSAGAGSVTPAPPNPNAPRTDHIVLRQREQYTPELVHVIGGAISNSPAALTLVASATATRASYFAKRGGAVDEQWWAWGDGSALKIKGGPGGEAFATATLLSGAGTVTDTWIAGQRASDGAVILLYVDGTNLKMVSFNPATGAQVDAPVALESLSNQILRPRAVLDSSERLHVTFQRIITTQQVYYARYAVVTGSDFGDADVSPRIVAGVDSGTNDTWPSIAVARDGTVTVAYSKGTGTNQHGDLMVATIDQSGNTTNLHLILAATDVAIDPGDGIVEGSGAVSTAFLNFRRPIVVVTPHDEVYVFVLGLSTGTDVDYLLVHSPDFSASHGFDLINAFGQFETGFSATALSAAAGEQGEVYLAYKLTGAANATKIHELTLNTGLLDGGYTGGPSYLHSEEFVDTTESSGSTDINVRPGPLGDFIVNYMLGTSVTSSQRSPLSRLSPAHHPNDIYFGSWTVPAGTGATLEADDKKFEIFNTRPKKMNYPFLVGNGGDYQGYSALHDALEQARPFGGDVVVRPGRHHMLAAGLLYSGVSIIGEGRAILVADNEDGALIAGSNSALSLDVTVSGSVVSSEDANFLRAKPGDIVWFIDENRYHTVLRNLGYDSIAEEFKILLEDDATGAPDAGAESMSIYSSGNRIENLTIVGNQVPAINLLNCYQAVIRNIRFEGSPAAVAGENFMLSVYNCHQPLLDGMDFTGMKTVQADILVQLEQGNGAVIRAARFADGKGVLAVDSSCKNVHLVGCSSDGADATKVIYDFGVTRDTPVFMTNCEGRISGGAVALGYLLTNIGARLRLPEGGGTMSFEDDNTRASTITDDGIKLSSTGHKEFDGTSKDVITEAVNERVKVGGDTMTGPLIPDVAGVDLGSSALPWDAYIKQLTVEEVIGEVTSPLVKITATAEHIRPLILANGRAGLPEFVQNPYGPPLRTGRTIGSIFNYGTLLDDPLLGSTSGTGSAVGGSRGMSLTTTAVDNEFCFVSAALSANTIGGYDELIGFSACIMLDSSAASRRDLFGYDENINVLAFRRDTDISNNWMILIQDSATDNQVIDTGFAPVADTWYYMTVQVLSLTSLIYRIGTTPDWKAGDTITKVTTLPGTGTLLANSLSGLDWDLNFELTARANSTRTTYYSHFYAWIPTQRT